MALLLLSSRLPGLMDYPNLGTSFFYALHPAWCYELIPNSSGPSFTEHSRDGRFSRSGDTRNIDTQAGPSTFRENSGDSMRDAPPYQNRNMPPPTTIPNHTRRPSQNARDMPPSLSPATSTAPPHVPPHSEPMRSPSISLSSPRSFNLVPTPLPQMPPLLPSDPTTLKAPTMSDIQSFSKDTMQTAAERARERRKLEEEQREREKERARQKAAELAAAAEARLAAEKAAIEQAAAEKAAAEKAAEKAAAEKATAEKVAAERIAAEAAAEALIREETDKLAKENAQSLKMETKIHLASSASPAIEPLSIANPLWRVRSSRGNKRGSDPKAAAAPTPRAVLTYQDSTGPHPLPSAPSRPQPPNPPSRQGSWANVVKVADKTDYVASSPSTIGGTSWRAKTTPVVSAPPEASSTLSSVHDVSAEEHDSLETIDFSDMGRFIGDDQETTLGTTPEVASPIPAGAKPMSQASHESVSNNQPQEAGRPANVSPPLIPTSTSSKGVGTTSPAVSAPGLMSPQALANLPLPPSKQHFRETSMSALEDVMSRIKGALHTMRPGDSNEEFDMALAAATAARKAVTDEAFAVTVSPRPSSPLGHLPRHHKVRLRKQWSSRVHRPIDERTLYLFKLPPKPVRMDILSWDPPIEGMSRKTLSRDEIHFSTDPNCIVVSLPISSKAGPSLSSGPTPKVNLPSSSQVRLPSSRLSTKKDSSTLSVSDKLDPMSRSPPPASPNRRASLSLPRSSTAATASVGEVTSAPAPLPIRTHAMNGRSKSISKPSGGVDAVDFYKRHVATDSSSSLVTFTVTSDLESDGPAHPPTDNKKEAPTKLIIDSSPTPEATVGFSYH